MKNELLDFLKVNDVKYLENESFAKHSPINIGAEAECIVYPQSEKCFVNLLRFLQNNKIQYKILGRMSNVLPPDEKYEKVIVKTDLLNEFTIEGQSLVADCGTLLSSVCSRLSDFGCSGFEPLSGIPGSIGGAIVGNSGAFGREVCELVEEVRVFDPGDGKVLRLSSDECRFDYRTSIFKKNNLVILSAKMSTNASSKEAVKNAMREYQKIRRERQPVGEPSLGSTFKRPCRELYAAKLIDDCGLRGLRFGGAKISEKHAGFIVNTGSATAKDYLSLGEYVKKQVLNKFSINLEYEVEIL